MTLVAGGFQYFCFVDVLSVKEEAALLWQSPTDPSPSITESPNRSRGLGMHTLLEAPRVLGSCPPPGRFQSPSVLPSLLASLAAAGLHLPLLDELLFCGVDIDVVTNIFNQKICRLYSPIAATTCFDARLARVNAYSHSQLLFLMPFGASPRKSEVRTPKIIAKIGNLSLDAQWP